MDFVEVSSIALDYEVAFQVCGQQILAAMELGDMEAANAYIAIRPALARHAFGFEHLR